MLNHSLALTLAAAACSGAMAFPDDAANTAKSMAVGDAAVPIEISHWLTGEEIKGFEDGKVYVLEFWATWCGPCRTSMPHLSEMQETYKDYGVMFIGVSDEPLATVVKFLASEDKKESKLWFEKIGYTLTTDPDESVKTDYFTAAGQSGIPCAFIIGKDQRVEWIGHPMSMDEALKDVVNDTWDRNAYKAKWEASEKSEREMMKAQVALRDARKAGDFKKAVEILDGMIASNEDKSPFQMMKFQLLLTDANQPKEGYALGQQLVKDNWDDAMMLNQIAWFVADTPSVKQRDVDFALKTAERACELTENKEAAILDTLARCYYEKHDLKKAVEIQQKAVDLSDDAMAEDIAATLKKYQDELKKKGA